MIDPTLYLPFLIVSTIVILVPGPNILVILATSLTGGRGAGMRIVFGVSAAMLIQLTIAAAGTAWLSETLAEAFSIVKWLGVAYLVYLGIGNLRAALASTPVEPEPEASGDRSFWRGFFVALTNPKTILFFGAFLPQFTSPTTSMGTQLAVLSTSFLMLATVINVALALAAGSARKIMVGVTFRRWFQGLSGALYIGSGVGLALTRRL